ncbi:MAG TPA: hypothetical protein PK200_18645, partial [Spirochaetota bacterium]|nr:hypothetical protein [Spirochaetota bacterium]
TVEDKREAERLYKKGIQRYVKGDVEGAIDEFEQARRKNPYHKNIEQKIEDLKQLKKLKKEGDKLEQDYQRYQFYQNR